MDLLYSIVVEYMEPLGYSSSKPKTPNTCPRFRVYSFGYN